MFYIGNAFSLAMIQDEDFPAAVRVKKLPPWSVEHLYEDPIAYMGWRRNVPWQSIVGHQDTADLYSKLLGIDIPMNRCTTKLTKKDVLLVGQYTGPRLPEGATSLPEGASITWFTVEIR